MDRNLFKDEDEAERTYSATKELIKLLTGDDAVEDDLECPEEHLKRNTCILNTDSGKVYCPHWDGCDSRSEKPWVYVPLK